MVKKVFSSIQQKLQNGQKESALLFPVALLFLALITYGLFIFSLGFYWDDWPPILLSHLADKASVFQYFTFDRPFQSWTYYVLFPLCRDSTFAWQLSVILFRWTAGLALYFTFLRVFPNQKTLLRWATALFIVYPGFADQYASVAYGSHLMVLTVFGLSLWTMVHAVQEKKNARLFFVLSLILTAVHLFTMEYFFGLEVLRPILLFLLVGKEDSGSQKRFFKTLKYWLPYLIVIAGYLYWRMILFPSESTTSYNNYPVLFESFKKEPLSALLTLLSTIYGDLRFVMVSSWVDRLLPSDIAWTSVTLWASIAIGLVVSFLFFLFTIKYRQNDEAALTGKEIGMNVLISIIAFFTGMAPTWSILRHITEPKWGDRFGLPVMFSVSVLVVTLLFLVSQKDKVRNTLLIVLIGLSIGFQIQTGNVFRKENQDESNFYNQLKWRIPDLEPGTLLLTPSWPTDKEQWISYTAGVNLLYTGDVIDKSLQYWVISTEKINPDELLKGSDSINEQTYRFFTFGVSSAKVVSFLYPEDGCLMVIDSDNAMLPNKYGVDLSLGKLTNPDLILEKEDNENGLADIYDFSKTGGWCYYYEKGDLAQSKGHDADAVALYEEAIKQNLKPREKIEYLPFIKAYVHLGKINEAVALSDKALNLVNDISSLSNDTRAPLCKFWHDTLQSDPTLQYSQVSAVYNAEVCPTYFDSGN